MSTTAADDRRTRYNPVVATTDFAADFPVFDNADLKVFVDGVERVDFAVTATYVDGISTDAKAVFAVGVTGTVDVVGYRDPHRTNRFVDGAPLPPRNINLALDTLEGEAQEARRDIERAVKVGYGVAEIAITPGTSGQVPVFDALGNLNPGSPAGTGNMLREVYDPRSKGGDVFPYDSIAEAESASIPAGIKRVRTSFHTPLYAVPSTLAGGAHYRRVSLADLTGYPTQSYFRSVDRFMLDETTDATNGGYWVIDETEVDWRMLGVKADNATEDTAACQAAMDFVGLSPSVRKLIMFGTCSVSKLTLSVGRPLVVEGVGCMLVRNAATPTTCVLEIKAPDCTTCGSITANALYSDNYECAIWIWHETQMQFCDFHGLVANNAKIGFRLGNVSYPSAIFSENVFHGLETSGCPYAVQVIGGETYLTIDNPKLSADSFGGDAAWVAKAKCAIEVIGATVTVTGGETVITSDTNGALYRFLPVDHGGGRIEWGSLIVDSVSCETGAPLCVIDDAGLTISSPFNRRGMVSFSRAHGFHVSDLASFIYVSAGYDDFLNIDSLNFWHPGTRTQPNIFCAGGSTCEITQRGEFGSGFKTGLAGIVGGRVNFGKRDVIRVKKLNGQAFTAASGPEVCLFQTVDTSGDKARWQASYNAATGTITVPDGGWEDVTAFITCRLTDMVTGSMRLLVNGSELVRTYYSGGCANLSHSLGNLAAGTTLKVDIDTDTNTTGIALDDFGVFCISAKRGMAA